MNEALKRAIEGGMIEGTNWKFLHANQYWALWLNGNGDEATIAVEKYLLSPDFWQCLGKAEGWSKLAPYELKNKNIPEWHYHWHKFIDHLAEGKPVDEFFEKLLK